MKCKISHSAQRAIPQQEPQILQIEGLQKKKKNPLGVTCKDGNETLYVTSLLALMVPGFLLAQC